jgi:hypothetical protein
MASFLPPFLALSSLPSISKLASCDADNSTVVNLVDRWKSYRFSVMRIVPLSFRHRFQSPCVRKAISQFDLRY